MSVASTTPFCNCLLAKIQLPLDHKWKILETMRYHQSQFSCVASIVTTAPEFISLPVAGKVNIVPKELL
jgi:hypothetical protein